MDRCFWICIRPLNHTALFEKNTFWAKFKVILPFKSTTRCVYVCVVSD